MTSGEVTGFKPAEKDWVGRGYSSPVADDSILGTPASLEKVAFTSEQGDEIGARRVGSELCPLVCYKFFAQSRSLFSLIGDDTPSFFPSVL